MKIEVFCRGSGCFSFFIFAFFTDKNIAESGV